MIDCYQSGVAYYSIISRLECNFDDKSTLEYSLYWQHRWQCKKILVILTSVSIEPWSHCLKHLGARSENKSHDVVLSWPSSDTPRRAGVTDKPSSLLVVIVPYNYTLNIVHINFCLWPLKTSLFIFVVLSHLEILRFQSANPLSVSSNGAGIGSLYARPYIFDWGYPTLGLEIGGSLSTSDLEYLVGGRKTGGSSGRESCTSFTDCTPADGQDDLTVRKKTRYNLLFEGILCSKIILMAKMTW